MRLHHLSVERHPLLPAPRFTPLLTVRVGNLDLAVIFQATILRHDRRWWSKVLNKFYCFSKEHAEFHLKALLMRCPVCLYCPEDRATEDVPQSASKHFQTALAIIKYSRHPPYLVPHVADEP